MQTSATDAKRQLLTRSANSLVSVWDKGVEPAGSDPFFLVWYSLPE